MPPKRKPSDGMVPWSCSERHHRQTGGLEGALRSRYGGRSDCRSRALGLEAVAEAPAAARRRSAGRPRPRSGPGAAHRAAGRRCRGTWSACSWVQITASTRSTSASRSCARTSGEVSTRTVLPLSWTRIEQRRRRLRGSAGIGRPPLALAVLAARPRNAGRGAAAQDRHPHSRSAPPWRTAGRNCRWSRPRARPWLTPFSSATLAAVWATKAGSLVLPRFGMGAR